MVDSINGAGGPSQAGQVNRTQSLKNTEEKRSERVGSPQDEVSLSERALEAQAEQTARETRSILEEQLSESLAADVKRVNQFI